MMISNQEQLLLLLRCMGCGVWLNLLWEAEAIVRRFHKLSKPVLFITDILLTVFSGWALFLFALAVNGGELRAVMLMAIAVGMIASHLSLGRWLQQAATLAARVFAYIDTVWSRCLKKSGEIGRKIRKKVVFFYKKVLQSRPSWVYNRNN